MQSNAKACAQHEVSSRPTCAITSHEEHCSTSTSGSITCVEREIATSCSVREGGSQCQTTSVERGDILAVHGVLLRGVCPKYCPSLQNIEVIHGIAEHRVVFHVQASLQVHVARDSHSVLEEERAVRRIIGECLVVDTEALAHVFSRVHLHERLNLERGSRLAMHAKVVHAAARRTNADRLGRVR